MIHYDRVPFTTDASGDATVYSRAFSGLVHAIHYVYGDADTGADFTFTDDATGINVLAITDAGTSDITWYPADDTVDVDGAAPSTSRSVSSPVVSRVKAVIAQGGASASGEFVIIWRDA